MLAVGAFFASLVFEDFANASAHLVADYVPSIDQLLRKGTPISICAANYFGLVALFLPLMILLLVWKEDVLMRARFGAEQLAGQGRGPIEKLVVGYGLGLPFISFVLYLMHTAPFDLPETPHLFGQHVIHFMLNSRLGLVLLGSITSVAAALFFTMLVALIWLPIAYLINNFWSKYK